MDLKILPGAEVVDQHAFTHAHLAGKLVEAQVERACGDERGEALFEEPWGIATIFRFHLASAMYQMVQVVYQAVQTKLAGGAMKGQSAIVMILFGVIFWVVGTLWYQARGALIFETTSLRYWANFVLIPVISALVCVGAFRWQQVPVTDWASAVLLIAIPGMAGEAVLLSNFAKWMPKMQAVSAGPYGGFLFATYALVLGVAEVMTIRAR